MEIDGGSPFIIGPGRTGGKPCFAEGKCVFGERRGRRRVGFWVEKNPLIWWDEGRVYYLCISL